MLLWVLPLAAIAADGWIIVALMRLRVRVRPEAFPESVLATGKGAGMGLFLPSVVVVLVVSTVSIP